MQLLAYVQTSRITGWKHMVHGSGHEAMAYGSRDKTRFKDLKRGDILWVIASSPGRNPSLVAKIVVDASGDKCCREVRKNPSALELLNDKDGRFPHVVTGGEGSVFFGFNDAGNALLDLTLLTSTDRVIRFRDMSDRWESKFGQYLQRPIRIAGSPKNNALEDLAEVCREKTVFISWKHLDHPRGRFPLQIARALVGRGFSVWFDLLALPPSKYLKGIRENQAVLANLLAYGYRQSRYLLAIDSTRYGTTTPGRKRGKNWTREEWEGALDPDKRRKRIRVVVLANRESEFGSSADHKIPSNIPDEIAKDFARRVAGN